MKDPRVKKIGPHYQCQRAKADGWQIQWLHPKKGTSGLVEGMKFWDTYQYRIVPDADGWLPWYAHEGAVCPVADGVMVEGVFASGERFTSAAAHVFWDRQLVDEQHIVLYRIIEQKEEPLPESDETKAHRQANTILQNENFWPDPVISLAREFLRLREEMKHCVPVEKLPDWFDAPRCLEGRWIDDAIKLVQELRKIRKEYGRE